jgi:hypothetical protein
MQTYTVILRDDTGKHFVAYYMRKHFPMGADYSEASVILGCMFKGRGRVVSMDEAARLGL